MFIRRAYYYLFYKLYKFWEAISIPKFWSDWKAELSIDVLEIFLGLSGICYYAIVNKAIIDFGSGKYIVCLYLLLIAIPNYFIFHHHDQWKQIVHEFDSLSKKNNRIGGFIVWAIILLIIANLVFAFYQLGQIDWKQYR
jgi:hypothetical protein